MPYPDINNIDLLRRRNEYSYPAICLDGKSPNWHEVTFPSTFALDAHINQKLHSAINEEVIVGYLATLFWGHASTSNGRDIRARAHGKVRLAYQGGSRSVNGVNQRIRGALDFEISKLVDHIHQAIEHIRSDRYGRALSELNRLPQLQIAFSSKLCAFIAPEKCGVIDSKIAKDFPELKFKLRDGFVSDTSANRERYDEYCIWLQQKALTLHNDVEAKFWIDRDGVERNWRAVDVERALYG